MYGPLYGPVWSCAVLFKVLYSPLKGPRGPYRTFTGHSTCTVLYTVLYGAVRCCTVLYGVVRCCTVLQSGVHTPEYLGPGGATILLALVSQKHLLGPFNGKCP